MDSRYSVRWVRRSGETVTIETMSDMELAAARHLLEREDPVAPVAAALFDAVADELDRRASAPVSESTLSERRAA